MSSQTENPKPALPWPRSLVDIYRRLKGERKAKNFLGIEDTAESRLLRDMGWKPNLAKSENLVTEDKLLLLMQKVDQLRVLTLLNGALDEDNLKTGEVDAEHSLLLETNNIIVSADPHEWSEDAEFFELYVNNPGFDLSLFLSFGQRYRLSIEFPQGYQTTPLFYRTKGPVDKMTDKEQEVLDYYLDVAINRFAPPKKLN